MRSVALTVLATWVVYGVLAAIVIALLLIGWSCLKTMREMTGVLEEIKLQAAELAAAETMFGSKPAGEVLPFTRPEGVA